MSAIFISYRRADTSAHAGRLYDRLSESFGPDRVVIDIDAIDAGADFVARTEEAVAKSAVVLALIGPQWLTRAGWRRRPRLADPGDFVRLELESALRHGALVIPVLVQGARFPSAGSLPPSLRALARRNAIELSDQRWRYDCDRLISTIQRTALPAEEADRLARGSPARDRAVEQTRRGAAAGARRQDADRGDRADATRRGPPEPEPPQSRTPTPSSATRGADRPWWLRLVGVLALVGTLIAAVVVGVQLAERRTSDAGPKADATVEYRDHQVGITRAEHARRLGLPPLSNTPEYLAQEGVEADFDVSITGYDDQELPIRLVLFDDDRHRIVSRNDSQPIRSKREVNSYAPSKWLPLDRPGRYSFRFEIYKPDSRPGDSPLAQDSTPPFRWPRPGPET